MEYKIKSTGRERPVPGLHHPKGISQRAHWNLIQASAVTDRLHAAWCNIQNVIMLLGTLTEQTVGKCVQCYGEKMCRPSGAKEEVVVQFGQLKYENPLKPADGG